MGRSDNDSEDGHRKSKKKKSKRYEESTVPDSVCSVNPVETGPFLVRESGSIIFFVPGSHLVYRNILVII
jgi:hypothetical protein